jgi:hypothetical protein
MALKGFAAEELEPRTSEGELVADLLASAGAPRLPLQRELPATAVLGIPHARNFAMGIA